MSPKPLSPLLLLLFVGCNEPSPGALPPRRPASSQGAEASAPTSAEASEGTPEKDDLKLKLDLKTPLSDTPKGPQKSDPECEEQGSELPAGERDALLKAYLAVQQDYLGREKAASGFKLVADPKRPLSYQLTFKDVFGGNGKMTYTFGKGIIGEDGKVTLCLDEGEKLLWAGTYRREAGKGFVPDI